MTLTIKVCLLEICKWIAERREKIVALVDTYFCWILYSELSSYLASQIHLERTKLPRFSKGKTLYES